MTSLASAPSGKTSLIRPVSPGIYRGPKPDADMVRELSEKGVRTVIDLQGGDARGLLGPIVSRFERGESEADIQEEREAVEEAGLRFVHQPLSSLAGPTAEDERRIREVVAALADPAHHPVYVHCRHGVDRTGMIIALHRVLNEGKDFEDAYREMIAHGRDLKHQAFTPAMEEYFFKLVFTPERWEACEKAGRWKTDANSRCSKPYWPGCSKESGARWCRPTPESR